jgi:hypothetical protein
MSSRTGVALVSFLAAASCHGAGQAISAAKIECCGGINCAVWSS